MREVGVDSKNNMPAPESTRLIVLGTFAVMQRGDLRLGYTTPHWEDGSGVFPLVTDCANRDIDLFVITHTATRVNTLDSAIEFYDLVDRKRWTIIAGKTTSVERYAKVCINMRRHCILISACE